MTHSDQRLSRSAFALAATFLVACSPPADRAADPPAIPGTGFHGFAWGTPPSGIGPLAGTEGVPGPRGVLVHVTPLPFAGLPTEARFVFGGEAGGLMEGSYHILLDLEGCEPAWEAAASEARRQYPHFNPEVVRPDPEGWRGGAYSSACEYYIFNAHREEWRLTLRNPELPGDSIVVMLGPVGRAPRLSVLFRAPVPSPETFP